MFPFKLISSLIKAGNIVSRFKPDVVIGTGGFASGPLLRVASGRNIPCVLQEQNSYAGITNKLLKDRVAKICVAYDGMEQFFPKDKIVKTGNPVRGDLVEANGDSKEALKFFGLNPERPTVFILGGSLGARRINQLIENELGFFEELGVQVLWQCGKLYYDEYKQYQSGSVKVMGYVSRMDLAYAAGTIMISRAGAGSVSELCIVGKPVIFIPSPNVAEDHQTKNAMALANENAAVLIREQDLTTDFETVFSEIFKSEERKEQLRKNIKKLAMPNATRHIVEEIEKLLR
jgi:UDP-N-acetylglucosamine--N-acetylmuramyl-(pentapeptide) pyrophosphoryl-undecaprenol N-acetylglucosamine transferase